MSDCHRRIEMFLGVLEQIGHSGELSQEKSGALEGALRYFSTAAPKHTADEEVSLFPRLRRHGTPEVEALMNEVERLEREHDRAESLHAEIDAIGQRWLGDGVISEADRNRFQTAIVELKRMYAEHIALEDRVIFPLSGRTLTKEEQREIGTEMAIRRGVAALHQVS